MVKTLPGTDLPASVLIIKYFVSKWVIRLRTLQLSHLLVTTKMHMAHIQCLVEGSI